MPFLRKPPGRALLALSAGLLAITFVTPLWTTHMEAPQYRGEEVLEVAVYAGRITGDIDEIETLNQYVGVHLPLDTPELQAIPWALALLLVVALTSLWLPRRRQRVGAAVLLALMIAFAVAGGAVLQYRLYEMGHVRDDPIFEGVPDFTPPLLGSAEIANFTVHMGLGLGGWAYLAALLLTGWACWAGTADDVRGADARTEATAAEERSEEAPKGVGSSVRDRIAVSGKMARMAGSESE